RTAPTPSLPSYTDLPTPSVHLLPSFFHPSLVRHGPLLPSLLNVCVAWQAPGRTALAANQSCCFASSAPHCPTGRSVRVASQPQSRARARIGFLPVTCPQLQYFSMRHRG